MRTKRNLVVIALFISTLAVGQTSADHKVSVYKGDIKAFVGDVQNKGERKVYKGAELATIGMPCGGIMAGQLYVRGDGTLANWWIANNGYNTGYGVDRLMNFNTAVGPWKVCYQTFEPFSYIEQGFDITVDDGQTKQTRELNKKAFDDISFIGEYPVAHIDYAAHNDNFPVKVNATVFSPFIPLNAIESANPLTVLKYRITNSLGKTVKVSLTGRLQNIVCIDLKESGLGTLRNQAVSSGNIQSLYMDLIPDKSLPVSIKNQAKSKIFEDFESGYYRKWTVEGEAFGQTPAPGPMPTQQKIIGNYGGYLVNSYLGTDDLKGRLISPTFTISDKYIIFDIAGGSYKGTTCINLFIGGKKVFTAEGDDTEELKPHTWDVSKWRGQKAYFEIIDEKTGPWGHICIDNIRFSAEPETKPRELINESHPYFGNMALSVFDPKATVQPDYYKFGDSGKAEARLGDKLIGALTSTVTLDAGESKEVIFVLSWYFPNRPLSYRGSTWNKPIPPNIPAIGNMYANRFNGSIDVTQWLYDNYERLEEETFTFCDTYYKQTTLPYWLIHRIMMPISTLSTETCQWWADGKFWAWEGVGSCEGTCTHVWGYAQAVAALFPELERNLREKTDYGVSLRNDGAIYARNGEHGILIDGHASVILRMYREHLMSKNIFFLSRNWDKVKKSIEYIISEDGNEDGLIVKTQPNTYDISFNGANTYVGALYLAALRAGEKMAQVMGDRTAAERYRRIYEAGKRNTMDRLWNAEFGYFIQDVDEKEYPLYQYGKGCLSDQLFGQTWADLLHLGSLYPDDVIDQALHSVWKYNWTNDVGPQTELHLPERYYAHSGEPGLLICTWPFSKHPGEAGVRYRDEVWTGIEYQVATGMIYRGMLDEALAIVKAVHLRYDGVKHNPWNEVECGDHYARALASYGLLTALQDYSYNGPEGIIGFAPRMMTDNFKGFFTAAEGWGNISQIRQEKTQKNSIEVKYGRVSLRQVMLQISANIDPKAVRVMLNQKPLAADYEVHDGIIISFDRIKLAKGDVLNIEIL
ncbi:MAG: hypothetical protein LBR84_02680 [Tannerella sp.]|jgi:uncharacterized protein (DUF608 family)|nr:hypothetical protein [Tannerella sp.]